jgi:hypothetical protein
MVPDSPILVIIFLCLDAIKGMVIGALSGWITSLATKCRPRRVWVDSLLGSIGFIGGFTGAIYMPWHQNTITYKLSGGITVTSTMDSYQHPGLVATAGAIALPILYELYRWMRARKGLPAPRPTSAAISSNDRA